MMLFGRRKALKSLQKYLDYVKNEIAESHYSPASSKELACILSDYVKGDTTIFRIVQEPEVLACSMEKADAELVDFIQELYGKEDRTLDSMEKLLEQAAYSKKKSLSWRMIKAADIDYGIIVIEKGKIKAQDIPDDIVGNLRIYIKDYNIVQSRDRDLNYKSQIPSKEKLLKLAETNTGAPSKAVYWIFVRIELIQTMPEIKAEETMWKCIKALRRNYSSDELYYYDRDTFIITSTRSSSEADGENAAEYVQELLNDYCNQPTAIVAIPYQGKAKEAFVVADMQLMDMRPYEIRVVQKKYSAEYLPRAEGRIIKKPPEAISTEVDNKADVFRCSDEEYENADIVDEKVKTEKKSTRVSGSTATAAKEAKGGSAGNSDHTAGSTAQGKSEPTKEPPAEGETQQELKKAEARNEEPEKAKEQEKEKERETTPQLPPAKIIFALEQKEEISVAAEGISDAAEIETIQADIADAQTVEESPEMLDEGNLYGGNVEIQIENAPVPYDFAEQAENADSRGGRRTREVNGRRRT